LIICDIIGFFKESEPFIKEEWKEIKMFFADNKKLDPNCLIFSRSQANFFTHIENRLIRNLINFPK